MNWDRIEGNWKHFVGAAKARWGKLTDDQLARIAGRRDQLAGIIQEAYGITREASQRQIDQWQSDQKGRPPGDDEKGERMAGPQDGAAARS
jgi:uncharacterized protein YjbJ (UPF0337 family)